MSSVHGSRMEQPQGLFLCQNMGWSSITSVLWAQCLHNISPFPYHPIGSAKTHSQVADEEGQRLQILFNDFAATLNKA